MLLAVRASEENSQSRSRLRVRKSDIGNKGDATQHPPRASFPPQAFANAWRMKRVQIYPRYSLATLHARLL
jgi:hypothetical protein